MNKIIPFCKTEPSSMAFGEFKVHNHKFNVAYFFAGVLCYDDACRANCNPHTSSEL